MGFLNYITENVKDLAKDIVVDTAKEAVSCAIDKHLEKKEMKRRKRMRLVLCVFLGFLGAHRFYDKQFLMGLLYLCTGGLFFIGWFRDIFQYFKAQDENE